MIANANDLVKSADMLREQISSSLKNAQAQKNTLQRHNSRYSVANLTLSLFATLLATVALNGSGAEWKRLCLFAAVCSAGATVTAKLQSAGELTEVSECVGQLKELKIETIAPTCDLAMATEKYQQILSEFTTIDC